MIKNLLSEKNLSIASKVIDIALICVSMYITMDLLDKNVSELKSLLNNKGDK